MPHPQTAKVAAFCNTLKTKFQVEIQFVRRSKHFISVIEVNQLILYRPVIAVCCEIHTGHKNSVSAERRISEC
jgi:hypothetical protein